MHLDQRNLGMSMRVERSSLDQVKKRFEMNKRKKDEKKIDYDFEERMKELKEEVCARTFANTKKKTFLRLRLAEI